MEQRTDLIERGHEFLARNKVHPNLACTLADFALSLNPWVETSDRLPDDKKGKWVTFVTEDGEVGVTTAYRTGPDYPWSDWETGDFFDRGEIIAWQTFSIPQAFVPPAPPQEKA